MKPVIVPTCSKSINQNEHKNHEENKLEAKKVSNCPEERSINTDIFKGKNKATGDPKNYNEIKNLESSIDQMNNEEVLKDSDIAKYNSNITQIIEKINIVGEKNVSSKENETLNKMRENLIKNYEILCLYQDFIEAYEKFVTPNKSYNDKEAWLIKIDLEPSIFKICFANVKDENLFKPVAKLKNKVNTFYLQLHDKELLSDSYSYEFCNEDNKLKITATKKKSGRFDMPNMMYS